MPSKVSGDFYMPCAAPAPHEIRGIPMCTKHYVEALEHGAHLDFGQWDGKDQKFCLKVDDQVKSKQEKPQ